MPRRPIVFTAVLAAGWLALTLWCDATGARKLRDGGLADAHEPIALVVTLDFEPEAFHMTRLQQAGRLVGVDHRSIRLADVATADMVSLAREYWVAAIRRDPGA